MKFSKIIFRMVFISLFMLYLSATTEIVIINEWVDFALMFLTLVMMVFLFIMRENIWEFLKYSFMLIVFSIAYVYVSPYITYRGASYKERQLITQQYRAKCLERITDKKRLKVLWELWEEISVSNENIHRRDLEPFEVLLFFMDRNNSVKQLEGVEKLREQEKSQHNRRVKKLYSSIVKIQEESLSRSVEKALAYMLNLSEEEHSLYQIENICYLASQKNGLLEGIEKGDKESQVNSFLLKRCKGY